MNREDKKFDKQSGAALILVVVVTVMLAAVGVMFLMISRLSEMETMAVADGRDLDNAVDTVVARIEEVLVEDFTAPTDYDLPWLASLEPYFDSGFYKWARITDLYESNWNVWSPFYPPIVADVISVNDSTVIDEPADADGDGVSDSVWVRVPGQSSSRGRDIFAAVRIIDNCAMLNLNTAYCIYQEPYDEGTDARYVDEVGDPLSPFEKPWFSNRADYVSNTLFHDNHRAGSGRYVTEINYLPFLRGRDLNGTFWGADAGDGWYNLMSAKGFSDAAGTVLLSPLETHNILMNMESAGMAYQLFDIGDELEIRNRYMLTSPVEARFEHEGIANFSLDSGGGDYSALEMPREDKLEEGIPHIDRWYWRVNPANFDAWSGSSGFPYVYDRRHVCTFYSFDRPQQKAKVKSVLIPDGAVTTDIRSFDMVQPYNNVETRRRILQLLFAFREYFYDRNGGDKTDAAKRAAQIVANIIDYSDDDAINPTSADRQGPFYDALYGEQANVDCTFITEQIVEDMIMEVSEAVLGPGNGFTMPFGLEATDVVFGYERQPFISEVYAYRDPDDGGALKGFAVELLNPYPDDMKLYRADDSYDYNEDVWRIRVGDGSTIDYIIGDTSRIVPKYDETNKSPGRYVIRSSASYASLAIGPLPTPSPYQLSGLNQINSVMDKEIQLLRPAPKNSGVDFIIVDSVAGEKVNELLLLENRSAIKRQDDGWRFIYPEYDLQQEDATPSNYTHTLGQANNVNISGIDDGFQMGVADDKMPVSRWHELETLSVFGNDPNEAVTSQIVDTADAGGLLHFNLAADTALSDYVCTLNCPCSGRLPGRININTAPVHVIAAAIPPTLADPNAATSDPVEFSALDLAQAIVDNRPYERISDLLKIDRFKQYAGGGARADDNVGMQSIEDDIEERHWVLSNLANKLTVRSDVFTAYILVRLGQDGPQRRMIAIFDRSNVWGADDRPELVALHPVPDPR